MNVGDSFVCIASLLIVFPRRYADKGVGDHNYCRNPAEKYTDVWCYTDSTKTRWDWCDVPTCGKIYSCAVIESRIMIHSKSRNLNF